VRLASTGPSRSTGIGWGRVLLLAKDFAPSSYLRDRLERRVTRPYSHDPKLRTNIRLRRFASPFEEFGLLYGSAAGNLRREDGSWSGALPNEAEAREHGVRILRDFVLPNMREDTLIMCLGEDAWRFACGATNQMGDWRTHRDLQIPLGNMIGAYHPARASNANQAGPWQLLARMLSEPWRRAQ